MFIWNISDYIFFNRAWNPRPVFSLQVGCKVLHFFHMYMLGCNYFWMLCEGIYLHTLIVVAVFAEEQHLHWYYLLGWGERFSFCLLWTYRTFAGASRLNKIGCSKPQFALNRLVLVPRVDLGPADSFIGPAVIKCHFCPVFHLVQNRNNGCRLSDK